MDIHTSTRFPACTPSNPSTPANSRPLPAAAIADVEASCGFLLRREVLDLKHKRDAMRKDTAKQLRQASFAAEKDELYEQIRRDALEAQILEQDLKDNFLPQHHERQLIGARALFVSPLFHVRSKSTPRLEHVELQLTPANGDMPIRYLGPELRQSDARVFLALVNVLRDLKVGVTASFPVREMCVAVFGRHDGDTRQQLREHIRRLQRGLLVFSSFSVQMVLRFDYPSSRAWHVCLDPHIVELFKVTPMVWLDLEQRLSLSDGLSSWLYGYIQSQSHLIPMNPETLRLLCGAHSQGRPAGARKHPHAVEFYLFVGFEGGALTHCFAEQDSAARHLRPSPLHLSRCGSPCLPPGASWPLLV